MASFVRQCGDDCPLIELDLDDREEIAPVAWLPAMPSICARARLRMRTAPAPWPDGPMRGPGAGQAPHSAIAVG
jgi:hypothetical protein